MFASHPAQTISLPRPSQDIPARWLVSTIDQALGRCTPAGCILTVRSLNRCMVIWMRPAWVAAAARQVVAERQTLLRQALQLEARSSATGSSGDKNAASSVAGRMSAAEGKKVAEWAQTLGWPLIGDVLSQTGQPLPCADLWLGNGKAVSELAQAQIVVQLGSSLTGKACSSGRRPASRMNTGWWIICPVASTRRSTAVAVCSQALSAGLELHPAEKRQPWATVIPQLAGQAWRAAVASNEPLAKRSWRSVFGAICRSRANCLLATAWWCA